MIRVVPRRGSNGNDLEPSSADEWMAIAHRELDDLRRSYVSKQSNTTKVDHALRAVEAALKAITWKHEEFKTWPRKGDDVYDYLYRHNLQVMLERCGLLSRLKKDRIRWASWQTVTNASAQFYRYRAVEPSDVEANAIAKSTRHPDEGVVPWLFAHFQTMS